MKLKVSYDSKEDIPEGYLEIYEEQNDKWILQAEGVKTDGDVERAMEAMRKQKDLRIEAERELSKYKDIDLEKWDKLKELDPDNLGDSTKDITEKVRERVEAIEAKYQEKEKELTGQVETVKERAKNYIKDSWLRKMLSEKFGFENPRRLNDFIRGMQDDTDPDFRTIRKAIDSIVVEEQDGQFRVVGKDLNDVKEAQEAVETIAKSDIAKHYKPAPGNEGGGSDNKRSGEGEDQVTNPYAEDTYNLTKQAELEETKPALAKKLAEEAGVQI